MFDFMMYADDTILSSTLRTFSNNIHNKSTQTLINELIKVIELLNVNKLSSNKTKSKFMIFHMPNKRIQTLMLKIDNVNIKKVKEFNYFGLPLDTNLSWEKHIQ